MSNEPKKTLPRIRTFAQDLELEREKHHLPLTTDVPASAQVPSSVAAAAIAADVPPQPNVDNPIETSVTTESASHTTTKETTSKPTTQTSDKNTPESLPIVSKTVQVREKKKDLLASRTESGGTVITDNKKVSPGFFSAITASIKDWLISLKTQKKVSPPKYSVINSERRKGVIQKATTKTGSIFTADSETLADEIRRRQPVDLSQKEAKNQDISWTPNTEPGYPLLPGATTNIQVAFKNRSLPQPEIIEPAPAVPLLETAWEEVSPTIQTITVKEKVSPAVLPPPEPAWGQVQAPAPILKPETTLEQRDVPSWVTSTLPETQAPEITVPTTSLTPA
jgi:hypothetical protein